jgi:carbonic anhydrase/acetyltransferase-like protein (isoleucine patch superfamily)
MGKYRIGDRKPAVASTAFVAREATLVGDVQVGERASVWFGAVARGDNEPIRIGAGTNIQEGAVLHADPGFPLTIGQDVSVGHQAMLHGCTVGDGALIGIQVVVLNGAVIGAECLVGAGALVTERKQFPPRSLIVGAPARVVRALTDEEVANLRANAADYARRSTQYREELQALD